MVHTVDSGGGVGVSGLAFGDGSLYAVVLLGGQFDHLGGRSRANLAAVRLPSGRFTSWRPRVNRYVAVEALAVSGRTVLAGGFFGQSLSC